MPSTSSKQHKSNQQEQHFTSSTSESGGSTTQGDQGLNLDIWNGKAKALESIILDYSFEPKRLEQPLTKFWTPSLKQEILSLAYYAAPLNQVESYIRKAYERNEEHLSNTLVEATIEAIKNGDVTLKDEKGNVIAEGMAEKLMKLHDELYPKDVKCIDKVRPMLPVENEKEKKDREDANLFAVNQVFDAVRQNDQHTKTAIKNFKEFVESTSPLNRIHLLFLAFGVLVTRSDELPKIDGESDNKRWGKLADRYCFEVIGAGIQKNLPPRMQQLLKTGLCRLNTDWIETGFCYIFNGDWFAVRELDVEGSHFCGVAGSNVELGVNCYYDDLGRRRAPSGAWGLMSADGIRLLAFLSFKTYYEHLHLAFTVYTTTPHQTKPSLM